MSKKRKRGADAVTATAVTFRIVEIDFEARTITIGGNRVQATTPRVTFPILSGDAVFMSRGDWERIA